MNLNRTSQEIETNQLGNQQSKIARSIPTLSPLTLSWILGAMCVIPVAIIFALFSYMPPVYEGLLEAKITAVGLPPDSFYTDAPYDKRPPVPSGQLVVENLSDQDWTHLNIQVNRHYQIIDKEPIKAHSTKAFDLDRFQSRTGARFQVRFNELANARIYARRPTRDRATYACGFEKGKPYELPETIEARARVEQP